MHRLALASLLSVLFAAFSLPIGAESAASGSSAAGSLVDGYVFYDKQEIEEHAAVTTASSGMENAKFAKAFTVFPPARTPQIDDPIADLTFSLPGRVFINYVDYEQAGDLVNSSTLMGINIYADSAELIDEVTVFSSSWTPQLGPSISMFVPTASEDSSAITEGYLLVEIAVFRPNAVRSISATAISSLEVIVNDGVLYSSDESPQFSTGSSDYMSYVSGSGSSGLGLANQIDLHIRGETAFYILSTSTALNVYEFQALLTGPATLYMDATSIAAAFLVSFDTFDTGNVIVFLETLRSHSISLFPETSGTVCLFVTDTLEVGVSSISEKENAALPGKNSDLDAEGAFTCAKAVTPERALRDISLDSVSLTASNETVTVSSTTSSGSTEANDEGSGSLSAKSSSGNDASSAMAASAFGVLIVILASTLV